MLKKKYKSLMRVVSHDQCPEGHKCQTCFERARSIYRFGPKQRDVLACLRNNICDISGMAIKLGYPEKAVNLSVKKLVKRGVIESIENKKSKKVK